MYIKIFHNAFFSQSIENHRNQEERWSADYQNKKKEFEEKLQEEEQLLQVKKEELERKTNDEILEMNEIIQEQLNLQQVSQKSGCTHYSQQLCQAKYACVLSFHWECSKP